MSIKVMRLCRPSFVQQQPLPLPSNSVGLPSVGAAPSVVLSSWLTVPPPSLGDIFLGEMFGCLISLANVSATELTQIALKVEVQTQVQRATLVDPAALKADGSGPELITLQPERTLEKVIHYKIKDVGVHFLICSVTFFDPEGERKYRKFFKFEVHNPLSMKSTTRMLDCTDEIIVETQLQNDTSRVLFLESVDFLPIAAFDVSPLTCFGAAAIEVPPIAGSGVGIGGMSHAKKVGASMTSGGDGPPSPHACAVGLPTFGTLAYLKPGDIQQHMYRLTPRERAAIGSKLPHGLGKMEVRWKGAMGEPGHLQSSTLPRRLPPIRPLAVSVLSSPAAVPIETPFTVTCSVTNTTSQERHLSLRAAPSALSLPIVLTGTSTRELGPIKPNGVLAFSITLVALQAGVHPPSGMKLVDSGTGEEIELDPLAPILVVGE